MAITRFERASEVEFGVNGSPESRTLSYIVEMDSATAEPVDGEVFAEAANPATYGSIIPDTYDDLPKTNIQVRQVLPFIYRVEITYSTIDLAAASLTAVSATAERSFAYGTGTERVLYSRETLNSYPGTATTYNNAIGVEGEGQNQTIGGAQSVFPVGRRSMSYVIPQASLTTTYEETIEDLVGKTNDDTFLGRAAGEVLFLGARGSTALLTSTARTAKVNARITFDFEVRKTIAQPVTIAGVSVTDDIPPFSYVWVRYIKKKGANGIVQEAEGVHVERLYDEGDFSTLGIPDGTP